MEVILIDDVFELGRRGQIVRVADGYGRNYLIPKRLAIPATPGNRKIIEQQRLSIAKKEAKYTEDERKRKRKVERGMELFSDILRQMNEDSN